MILGPKYPTYYPFYIDNNVSCLSGIITVSSGEETKFSDEKISRQTYLINDTEPYSSFKRDFLRIIEKYFTTRKINNSSECMDILKLFHDDLLFDTLVFLNNKKKKKSLLKFLKDIRKKILDDKNMN